MPFPQNLALPVVFAIGALLIGWYIVGNEVMRRRGRNLAVWCKRSLDPLGPAGNPVHYDPVIPAVGRGAEAAVWFRHAYGPRGVPRRASDLARQPGNGRRDMVLLQVSLRHQPIWGFELYRPRSVLAADARKYVREEGWTETAFVASGSPPRAVRKWNALRRNPGVQKAYLGG